uniref:Uncharacterized protein n=1 Tax=Panagrolaimus sp. ES5 TaxID=591445 RepID=A0AC34FTB5_9BILA
MDMDMTTPKRFDNAAVVNALKEDITKLKRDKEEKEKAIQSMEKRIEEHEELKTYLGNQHDELLAQESELKEQLKQMKDESAEKDKRISALTKKTEDDDAIKKIQSEKNAWYTSRIDTFTQKRSQATNEIKKLKNAVKLSNEKSEKLNGKINNLNMELNIRSAELRAMEKKKGLLDVIFFRKLSSFFIDDKTRFEFLLFVMQYIRENSEESKKDVVLKSFANTFLEMYLVDASQFKKDERLLLPIDIAARSSENFGFKRYMEQEAIVETFKNNVEYYRLLGTFFLEKKDVHGFKNLYEGVSSHPLKNRLEKIELQEKFEESVHTIYDSKDASLNVIDLQKKCVYLEAKLVSNKTEIAKLKQLGRKYRDDCAVKDEQLKEKQVIIDQMINNGHGRGGSFAEGRGGGNMRGAPGGGGRGGNNIRLT